MSDAAVNAGKITLEESKKLDTSCYLPAIPWPKFIMVCCVFSLWGIAGSLNEVLVPQFRKGFELTDLQSSLVQSVFFFGYFAFALPAAAVVKKYSYKTTIVVGLALYAVGCFLFIPASYVMTYNMFLLCLLVIASGLAFLETSCNTYSSLMGPIETSTQRINFSQIFNSVGVFSGIWIGQQLVFDENHATREQLTHMAPEEAASLKHDMLLQVVNPYMIMAIALIMITLFFAFNKFPACKSSTEEKNEKVNIIAALQRLFAIPHFREGVLSQFFYVGAQVGVWTFTIRFVQMIHQGTTEYSAANWLMTGMVIYAIGKVIATIMMKKMEPSKLLGIFAGINVFLLIFASLHQSSASIFAVIAANLFMAPCFPTNFGLCVKGLGKDTQFGGSLAVMAIVGGAIVPPIMGAVSDMNGGNMQIAFLVPALCFVFISYFGFNCYRKGM